MGCAKSSVEFSTLQPDIQPISRANNYNRMRIPRLAPVAKIDADGIGQSPEPTITAGSEFTRLAPVAKIDKSLACRPTGRNS
jgi:hypothetical protein